MSVALITGLGSLAFGLGYNKAYKGYTQNKINLNIIKMHPRDTRPRPEFYYTVQDVAAMEQAEYEWDKYNTIRKYYYRLMIEKSEEYKREIDFSCRRRSEFWIPKKDLDRYKKLKEQCSDIVIKSNAYCYYAYGYNKEQNLVYLDERFSDIYKEMLSQGINLELRPGIDRLERCHWNKGIEGGEDKGWFPQDVELISQGQDPDTLCGFKYIFTKYGLDNVHMDYKRFYKPQYVV